MIHLRITLRHGDTTIIDANKNVYAPDAMGD